MNYRSGFRVLCDNVCRAPRPRRAVRKLSGLQAFQARLPIPRSRLGAQPLAAAFHRLRLYASGSFGSATRLTPLFFAVCWRVTRPTPSPTIATRPPVASCVHGRCLASSEELVGDEIPRIFHELARRSGRCRRRRIPARSQQRDRPDLARCDRARQRRLLHRLRCVHDRLVDPHGQRPLGHGRHLGESSPRSLAG